MSVALLVIFVQHHACQSLHLKFKKSKLKISFFFVGFLGSLIYLDKMTVHANDEDLQTVPVVVALVVVLVHVFIFFIYHDR